MFQVGTLFSGLCAVVDLGGLPPRAARHLMFCVKSEAKQVLGTGAVPLAPACMQAQAFSVMLLDERGMFAGTLAGLLMVKFAQDV